MEKKVGLLLRLVAKDGKENAVYDFIKGALPLANAEHETATWYAIQISENTFGILILFLTMLHVKLIFQAQLQQH